MHSDVRVYTVHVNVCMFIATCTIALNSYTFYSPLVMLIGDVMIIIKDGKALFNFLVIIDPNFVA